MNAYAVAKFIASVDEVDSRKRLQKALFFVQEAGCKLDAEYELYLYGPYSRDLAIVTDQLEAAKIIEKQEENNGCGGVRYRYIISDTKRLEEFEATEAGKKEKAELEKFVPLFKRLNTVHLWELELASTVAYYHRRVELDWDEAKKRTAAFKKEAIDSPRMMAAEKLAHEVFQDAA
ncbi:MAG TPA: hypothetical protein ENH84_01595 [Phycisphaerae bacterium]|nr:hypothetical protein [Phycisphaerae bacterium]